MRAGSVDEKTQVARRGLPAPARQRGAVRERGDPLAVLRDDIDGRPLVDAEVHALGAVEAVAVARRQQVEDAAGARAGFGLEIRDGALAGADRDVEAE